MQTTSHLLMISPVDFRFNTETAVNNAFQVAGYDDNAQEKAKQEFDGFVEKLRKNGIDVTVVNDSAEPNTPDSIFPNNWISFHSDGRICLYPMFAENRRLERKPAVVDVLRKKFEITGTVDLSNYESEGKFLEGTGSMVLDRDNKIAYACLSPRTDAGVLKVFGEKMDYQVIPFRSVDASGREIYHTNVMMCVADRYVVICLDSIPDKNERKIVEDTIRSSGKETIPISYEQMEHFAGNMLQVQNDQGKKFLVMSTQAFQSLNPELRDKLESYNPIIHSSLDTIETNGGGSARCMMAEVFLQTKS